MDQDVDSPGDLPEELKEEHLLLAAEEYVKYWRSRLGLHGWDILVARPPKINTKIYANVSWDVPARLATVRLHDVRPEDLNKIILHELLHLLLAEAIPEQADGGLKEAAVHGVIHKLILAFMGDDL